MKILIAHNHYQKPGGEDSVFAAEVELLRQHGNEVHTYVRHNDEIVNISVLRTASKVIWNDESYWEIIRLIREIRPDVTHFHNIFPLISPAAYYAAKAEGVPVVQTLHNYRLLCPGGLIRDGWVCEKCLAKIIPWYGLFFNCYRGSKPATSIRAAMLVLHRIIRTYTTKIDTFIALTEFSRSKYIQGGLSAEKIVVKPNFIMDYGKKSDELRVMRDESAEKFALFVGRLSPEKGLKSLLTAWEQTDMPLKIVGDGPMTEWVTAKCEGSPHIHLLGQKNRQEVFNLMGEASILVFPSTWYEGFPLTIVEAFSKGLLVVSSKLGSMSTIINHGRTGLHFTPGDPNDLADKVRWLISHPKELSRMRIEARAEYEAKYTAERNYEMLMEIYQKAIQGKKVRETNKPKLQNRINNT